MGCWSAALDCPAERVANCQKWWQLHEGTDTRYLVCIIPHTRALYSIPLNQVGTPEGRLEWIAQVMEKRWATPAIVHGLLKALDATVGLRGSNGRV